MYICMGNQRKIMCMSEIYFVSCKLNTCNQTLNFYARIASNIFKNNVQL